MFHGIPWQNGLQRKGFFLAMFGAYINELAPADKKFVSCCCLIHLDNLRPIKTAHPKPALESTFGHAFMMLTVGCYGPAHENPEQVCAGLGQAVASLGWLFGTICIVAMLAMNAHIMILVWRAAWLLFSSPCCVHTLWQSLSVITAVTSSGQL